MKNWSFTFLIVLFFCLNGYSQEITVLESIAHSPVAGATIVVINNKSNRILQQGSTNTKGKFSIQTPKDTGNFVSVSAIGFIKQIFPLNSLGNPILLKQAVQQLKTVTIKSNYSPFKIIGNKMEYDISQIPNADYLNTVEILDHLPFLQVDDNQLKMMNEPISILIDGRTNAIYSTLNGLKTLPPQAIAKVELTLVPTARGNGGKILNIILKRDYFLGFNGSVEANASALSASSRASMTYWHKKYGFDASINYNQSIGKNTSTASINNLQDSSELQSKSKSESTKYNGDIYLSAFYNLNNLNSFDLQLSLSPSKINTDQIASNLVRVKDTYLSGKSSFSQDNSNYAVNVSLNYTKKSVKDGNVFYLLTNFVHSNPKQSYFLTTQGDIIGLSNQHYANSGQISEETVEAILQQNADKKFKYTLGSKLIARNNSNEITLKTDSTNTFTPFKMTQIVNTTYVDADLIIKTFVIHTAIKLDYNHNNFILPNAIIQDFLSFIPNISLTYNLNRSNVFLLTYGRTLTRPGLYQYTPVGAATDSYEVVSGNQNLKNELTNNWGLAYYGNYHFARIGINFRYVDITGLLREISSVDSNNVVQSTPINVDTYHGYTLGISADFQLFKKIRVSHNSSLSYLYEKTGLNSINQWSGYLSERLYYQINKKSMVGINLTKYSPNLLPQGKEQSLGYIKADINYGYYFDISKRLPASLSLTLTNPNLINGYRSYYIINSPELIYRKDGLRTNSIAIINFRISLKGRNNGNRTFNKEKSIQNSDLHTAN
ncbi:outer membrane beta-barrel family protein [Mucilaginibacter dorajii]|uniref:Outer membrane beta-barrel family protein n=1 Tax=Mucilaginibacter dorajii TaxID=692994 RepID=A0ABP7QYK8_9SPHI|nr:outer membrane beta-barrel family protein [Mucilaginibacter dorajii]MCS3732312.1 outer membrane receptor protein involved in Fe transport [Mucilaginibacter dorajii]